MSSYDKTVAYANANPEDQGYRKSGDTNNALDPEKSTRAISCVFD